MVVAEKTRVMQGGTIHQQALALCKRMIAPVLKMDADDLDSSVPLDRLGVDSIVVGQINARLEEYFGNIDSTLLFECKTIEALARYLAETYEREISELVGLKGRKLNDDQTRPAPSSPAATDVRLNPRVSRDTSSRPRVARNRRISNAPKAEDRRIAIIGLSGKYPQAADLEQYWQNLASGKDCITEIPSNRWPQDGFYTADVKKAQELGRSYSKWGGFVEEFSEFDASFFDISPLEALSIDPQERLFLQSAWHAMEDAGYTRATFKEQCGGKVGVFAGITKLGYNLYGSSRTISEDRFFPRTSFSSVANRLSYILDLNGPSMPVDTMCSSSLTAIHEACENIHRGDCKMAFAGGVNLYLHPSNYIDLSAQGMLSRAGRCSSFGVDADGFAPGEGVGVVLLKPLIQAQTDRDPIHGVILATHVNHGGRSNGYAVPNPGAQAEVIRGAIDKAGISPREISYIEAHGTGTELGDSIEISVLQQAFGTDSDAVHYCRIGSVKSNIGHCESAAGISGLTKTLLQMKHRQLAPTLHCENVNPHIALEGSPFVLNRDLVAWEPPVVNGQSKPRTAGISSFGAGGTNAHVLVQEYLPAEERSRYGSPDGDVAIVLSAASKSQLKQRATDLSGFLSGSAGAGKHDISPGLAGPATAAELAYTLQVGREPMSERLAFVADSLEQVLECLQAYVDGRFGETAILESPSYKEKDTLSLFNSDADLQDAIDKWLDQGKLDNLLKLWIKGVDIDWRKLYGASKPSRISLPVYPFARQRYWIDTIDSVNMEAGQFPRAVARPRLHSLLHENVSDITRVCYRSTFSGEEFFASRVQPGRRHTFPEALFLEMARAALALAVPDAAGAANVELSDVVWGDIFAVRPGSDLFTALRPGDGADVRFEIYTMLDNIDAVVCRGRATYEKPVAGNIDMEQLKNRFAGNPSKGATEFDAFHENAGTYGDGSQVTIESVLSDDSSVLLKLVVGEHLQDTLSDYVVHPVLIECVCRAASAAAGSADRDRLFAGTEAIRSVQINARCAGTMYALIQPVPSGSGKTDHADVDIDLIDSSGKACLQMRSVQYRDTRSSDYAESGLYAFSVDRSSGPAVAESSVIDEPVEKMATFLTQQISVQLGLPFQSIERDTRLIDLGVDSVGITKLLREINSLLDETVSAAVVFQYPDINRLSRYLAAEYRQRIQAIAVRCDMKGVDREEKHKARRASAAPRSKPASGGAVPSKPKKKNSKNRTNSRSPQNNNLQTNPGAQHASPETIVPIQPDGERIPIFGMPGGWGNPLALLPLSVELGVGQPFYGLQAVGLDGKRQPLDRIEKMAQFNIDVIRDVRKHGPFRLLGYSNGGVVAYEMARMLLEQGEQVESLVLLDTICPLLQNNSLTEETVYISNNFFKENLGVELGLDVDELDKVPYTQRCEYLYDLMSAKGLDISRGEFDAVYEVARANFHCARNYTPTSMPTELKIRLYRAVDAYPQAPSDYGWNRFLKRPLDVVNINTNHIGIINGDAIKTVAGHVVDIYA